MPSRLLKIFILEDNDDLRKGWMTYFESQGHHVRGAALADDLLIESSDFNADVYVVDLNLPDADGLEIVKRLRAVQPQVGIVISTARSRIGDKVKGYDSGADIYFTKPIDPEELMASICALSKRRNPSASFESALRLVLDKQQLVGPSASVDLTLSDSRLLSCLVRASGKPLARWQIAEMLGLSDELPSDAMLEMRIARLRKRLLAAGAVPPVIRALHKQGYVLLCNVVLD